jgi:hypothetical protein
MPKSAALSAEISGPGGINMITCQRNLDIPREAAARFASARKQEI